MKLIILCLNKFNYSYNFLRQIFSTASLKKWRTGRGKNAIKKLLPEKHVYKVLCCPFLKINVLASHFNSSH